MDRVNAGEGKVRAEPGCSDHWILLMEEDEGCECTCTCTTAAHSLNPTHTHVCTGYVLGTKRDILSTNAASQADVQERHNVFDWGPHQHCALSLSEGQL